jgi:nickel-dependent lactate racemase
VDDITRQTPAWAILPSLLRSMAQSGCPAGNIKILIAAGTHAPMTGQEIEQKLGKDIARDYSVTLHHWRDQANLRHIGQTGDGTPIFVNRMLGEADFVLGIGQIVPHRVMGYTGGASIVQPGVSGPGVTGYTHWMSALYPGADILGIADNPVRLEVEHIAQLAGLRFVVNVVMDAQGRVLQVVAGDPVAAHRKGAEYSRSVYGVPQPALADSVVAESYPADYDLWQAAKGIYSSELAVRLGGVVILVTPCPHGVSAEHPEVENVGYEGFETIKNKLASGEITDRVAAAHLAHVGRIIRDRAQGIMVSPGIGPATQRSLGFISAQSPQEALELALAMLGQTSTIVVLRHGGDVLPVVASKFHPRGAEARSTAGPNQ